MDDRTLEIRRRLSALESERKLLLAELEELPNQSSAPPLLGDPVSQSPPLTPPEKISLFLQLFRCREDVYPRFWQSPKTGKSGYSPVCGNEWGKGVCLKPQVKCSECPARSFARLDSSAAAGHLQGKAVIGTYAIRQDDTCVFLAADFDRATWNEDVLAYKNAAAKLGIDAAVERSRSGNGAHAWIFFSQPIPARSARQLGTVILAQASSGRFTIGLDSHDRFFPNQDFLPKGGFGNLIALPLQQSARRQGNTVFVDDRMVPYQNQWDYLSSRRRLSPDDVRIILDKTIGYQASSTSCIASESDIQIAERAADFSARKVAAEHFTDPVKIHLGAQLAIDIEGLPSRLIAAFKRTATFANPKFYERQRQRFSTWNIPRYIVCGELSANHLILPRGNLEACLKLSREAGAEVDLVDQRATLKGIKTRFRGKLTREQKKAFTEISRFDDGVLVAPPGIGKTVIACAVLGKRKVPTLVLVHRKQLLEQWRSQLSKFLTIDPGKIGVIAGNSKRSLGFIDIAMLQTLSCLENPGAILSKYGQVIVDECHHIPAYSFESVIKKIPARYFLGLTATPYRKDGQQAIIHMQCGPVRYEMADIPGRELTRRVRIRETSFALPPEAGPQPPISEIWAMLASDSDRLDLIAGDVAELLEEGRFPLILSERTKHLQNLSEAIRGRIGNDLPGREFYFDGKMGKKARKKALEDIQEAIQADVRPYILSTGSLIGEGFDLPALDTLVLAMPISFKGRLIQYAGRLHRTAESKSGVLIYDYLDKSSGLTVSMFRKRLATYRKMGYRIESDSDIQAKRNAAQGELFTD